MKLTTAALCLAIVLLAPLLCGPAAAEWSFLTKSLSGVPLYYDRESVRETPGATVIVKTKAVFTEASPIPAGLEDYHYSLGLIELNCRERMYLIRQVVVHDHDSGTLTASSPDWGALPPEPQLEKLFEVVCGLLHKGTKEETRGSPPAETD